MTPAAEHRLLTEEVGLGLLLERRLDHPGAGRAERGPVGERELARTPARILRDCDNGRRAVALFVEPPDDVARALGSDHDHVVAGRGRDAPVVDVEPVGEEQRGAGLEVRRHLVLVERRAARRPGRGTPRAARREPRRRPTGRSARPPPPRRESCCRHAVRPRPRRRSRAGSARGRGPGCRTRAPRPCRSEGSTSPDLMISAMFSIPFAVFFRLERRGLRSGRRRSGGAGRPGPCARAHAHRRGERAPRMPRPGRGGRRARR